MAQTAYAIDTGKRISRGEVDKPIIAFTASAGHMPMFPLRWRHPASAARRDLAAAIGERRHAGELASTSCTPRT